MATFNDGDSYLTIRQLINSTGIRKNNFAGGGAPAVGDDTTQDYEVGSLWLNTGSGTLYVATDVSTGAAVWSELGAGASYGNINVQSYLDAQGYSNVDNDNQILTWDEPNSNLSISGGNTITLTGLGGGGYGDADVITLMGAFTTNDITMTTGDVTANSFIGDGSQLTNLPSGAAQQLSWDQANSNLSISGGGNTVTLTGLGGGGYDPLQDDIVLGNGASNSSFTNTVAVGHDAEAFNDNGIAVGFNTRVNDNSGIALGPNSTSTGTAAIAIGSSASAATTGTIAIGNTAAASALNDSIAIGRACTASGTDSITIGAQSQATATGAVAVGRGALSQGNDAVALGDNSQASLNNSIVINSSGSVVTPTTTFGIDIRSSAAGSLTYDTANAWTFGSNVTVNGTLEADQVVTSGTGALTFDSASTITFTAPDGYIFNGGDLSLEGNASIRHTFDVVNNGSSDYQFTDSANHWFPSAENDPVLYLRRGETYVFDVNASTHPFEIRVSSGGVAYSTGVTNNATDVGQVIFKVPMGAPATLYYQCTVHPAMGNTINIV